MPHRRATQADLSHTYLVGANLRGANLAETNLAGAVLQDADLRGAHLKGTHIKGSTFSDPEAKEDALDRGAVDDVGDRGETAEYDSNATVTEPGYYLAFRKHPRKKLGGKNFVAAERSATGPHPKSAMSCGSVRAEPRPGQRSLVA
jgi:hypothetical protein